VAHVRGLEVVGTYDVGFVPKGVAYEVAGVVGMDIDFLLDLGDGRLLEGGPEVVEGVGATREDSENKEKQCI
jgi:hypothetical protein